MTYEPDGEPRVGQAHREHSWSRWGPAGWDSQKVDSIAYAGFVSRWLVAAMRLPSDWQRCAAGRNQRGT